MRSVQIFMKISGLGHFFETNTMVASISMSYVILSRARPNGVDASNSQIWSHLPENFRIIVLFETNLMMASISMPELSLLRARPKAVVASKPKFNSDLHENFHIDARSYIFMSSIIIEPLEQMHRFLKSVRFYVLILVILQHAAALPKEVSSIDLE